MCMYRLQLSLSLRRSCFVFAQTSGEIQTQQKQKQRRKVLCRFLNAKVIEIVTRQEAQLKLWTHTTLYIYINIYIYNLYIYILLYRER